MSFNTRSYLGTQLAQTSRSWRGELDRRLSHLGLSQARWVVLLHLARHTKAPTQRELARIVGVEGPTLARLLDALEKQKLVTRQAVAEDRRANSIELTEKASGLISEIEAIAATLCDEVLDGIDDRDVEACQRTLKQIQTNLERSKLD